MKNSKGDKFTMPQTGSVVSMNIFKGNGADMESKIVINSCTNACTHCNQVVGPEVEWLEHANSATQKNPSFHISMLMQWSRHGESGREKYILMHVHLLTKVWEQKWDDCKTYIATHWHQCSHITMHRGWSWIQNSGWHKKCTDACSHSIQVVETKIRWMGHKYTATQRHPCFCVTMHRGLRWY